MSRKKRNGVKKLSDDDYAKYIMALKDEKPPALMSKTQEQES